MHASGISGKRQILFVHCKRKTEWQPYIDMLKKETEDACFSWLAND
jgi:hypothetical protein